MNERNEHFTMILDVLKQMQIKPNKQSLDYADKFIQSNGGYFKYYDSYKLFKNQKTRSAVKAPNDTPENEIKVNKVKPPKPPAYQPKKQEQNEAKCAVETTPAALFYMKKELSSTPPPLPSSMPSSTPAILPQIIVENTHQEPRNALLDSIVNFKGKLKKVEVNKHTMNDDAKVYSKFSNEQNNIINQLFVALDEMRPYLSEHMFEFVTLM